MQTKLLMSVAAAAMLAACGGADPGPLPEAEPPTIADPGPLSVTEYASTVTKLSVASPTGNAVTMSVSGPDGARFSVGNDGTLRFLLPPDFTTPADADADNVYEVTVTADDSYSKVSRDLTVAVTSCPSCRVNTASANVSTDPSMFVADNIIADFEYPALIQTQTTKYTLAGAFAATTNWNNLEYNNRDLAPLAARIGSAAVTTCEIGGAGCDAPTGSITINDFTVTQKSITFLMSGGNGTNPVGVQVIYAATGQVIGDYRPNSCGDPVLKGNQHFVYFDTTALIGEKLRLRIYDEASEGCGFVAFDHFYQTDTPRGTLAGVLVKP